MLERHPNLKIIAVHGGGYLAAYSGRIDHSWGARSDAHGDLPHPPTSYLKKIYFDSVVFTPYQLAELVRLYGADRIIMGTDYPFDMADYDPIGHVAGVEGFDAPPSPRSPAATPSDCWDCSRHVRHATAAIAQAGGCPAGSNEPMAPVKVDPNKVHEFANARAFYAWLASITLTRTKSGSRSIRLAQV